MKKQIIFILGDVHSEFGKLNRFIDERIRKQPVFRLLSEDSVIDGDPFEILIFQVGDFGYFWPGFNNKGKINTRVDFLPDRCVKIYWCGGNHEDWDQIDMMFDDKSETDNIVEIDSNIFLCRFGATLDLFSGQTVLFAGGAESIDKKHRLQKMAEGHRKIWWAQEGIMNCDIDRLANVPKADIVISHTAPMLFNLRPFLTHSLWEPKPEDNLSREKLDIVFHRYMPKQWFFGHFHVPMKGYDMGCQWIGLADMATPHDGDEYTILNIEEQPYA